MLRDADKKLDLGSEDMHVGVRGVNGVRRHAVQRGILRGYLAAAGLQIKAEPEGEEERGEGGLSPGFHTEAGIIPACTFFRRADRSMYLNKSR